MKLVMGSCEEPKAVTLGKGGKGLSGDNGQGSCTRERERANPLGKRVVIHPA